MLTRTIYLFDDLGNKVAVGTYEPAPVSLTVGGSWTNTQYTGSTPDPTGLTFTCTFSDGTSSSVVPTSVSPSTWSSTAGTQTATFSYTAGGVTVTGSKSVSVENEPEPVTLTIYTTNIPHSGHVAAPTTGEGTYHVGDTVTVSAYETGTFFPDQISLKSGDDSTVPIPPEPEQYQVSFQYWEIDFQTPISYSNPYTFIITEDTYLYAIYR